MGLYGMYSVEVFFRKPEFSDEKGLDKVPDLDKYLPETEVLKISTWDSVENEVLRTHPNAAYILIHEKQYIEPMNTNILNQKYETELLKISNSPIHERGVFAKKDIPKDFVIFLLTGDIVHQDELDGDYPSGEWNALTDKFFLVRKERSLYGYINHSRNPNCYIDVSTFQIKTLTSIKAGEEITIDYRKEPLPKEYLEGFGATYL